MRSKQQDVWTERRKGVDDNPGGKASQYRPELDARLDKRGSGHVVFLSGRSLVPGRPCRWGNRRRMVLENRQLQEAGEETCRNWSLHCFWG